MKPARLATVIQLESGRHLAFREYGDPDGIPVFGFHGTPGTGHQISPVDEPARRLGVRIIAPDRPGAGYSDHDPYRRLVEWPGDVAAIADYLELDRFGIFGVSGGGPHAAVCAHALGERLLGAAIVCGAGPLDRDEALEGAMPTNRLIFRLARRSWALVYPLMALMAIVQRLFPDRAMKQFAKQLPEPDRRILERPEVMQVFREDARRTPRTGARAAAREMALFARPWGFRLEDIQIPVHLWQGDLDRNVPAALARLQADRIPNSKLHECPGEGHLLVMDRADEILRVAAGLDPA